MSKEQIEQRLELSSIIGCAVNDWGDFCEECHKDGYSPTDTLEEYVAVSVITKGYRKQREGEWVDQYQGMYVNQLYKCSLCGETAFHDDKRWFLTHHCPNCGAKMKGV